MCHHTQSRRSIMSEGIQGKVVLITGGGTGLGAETARLLASKGAVVAVAGRRKNKVNAVVDAVIADFGKLDVLINNAGLMPIRPMAEVNTDEWDAMIDINIKGVLYGIAAALPVFLAQESGHF